MPRAALVPRLALVAVAVALVATLALAVPAAGQDHEHGAAAGPVTIAHDGPANGRQFVGNLAHFAAIAHGSDAVPDFHQDVPMRVTLNGQVLFQTTAGSGHDYDGINVLDIVFPQPGPYKVEALDAAGNAVATFAGEVLPAPEGDVHVAFDAGGGLVPRLAGDPQTFTFGPSPGLQGAEPETPLAHTDCWFEVLSGGRLEFRTKTHTHEAWQVVDYTFQRAGTHEVRVLCFQAYPSANANLFAPTLHVEQVQVLPGPPANAVPVAVTPQASLNAVVQGAAGGELLLVGTFDPYTLVGPDTLQHLVVAAVDPATGVPRQHVDFTATYSGPAQVLFASETLHEYDGLYELSARQAVPGAYTLSVTADAGDWSDTIQMTYTVAPPVAPTSAGPVGFHLAQASMAGAPTEYTLGALAASGPFAHSEVELRVLGDGPVPVLQTKLHTHDDGAFPFWLGLPAGGYRFEVDGFPLMPEAVLVQLASFDVDVPAGQVAAPSDLDGGDDAARESPGLAGVLVLSLLSVLAWALRR